MKYKQALDRWSRLNEWDKDYLQTTCRLVTMRCPKGFQKTLVRNVAECHEERKRARVAEAMLNIIEEALPHPVTFCEPTTAVWGENESHTFNFEGKYNEY